MDKFSKEKRSEIMRQVKSRNTKPEKIVRSLIHSMGFRFRLHKKDLPGKPDMVFPSKRKVVFVHGCFWHGHNCKRGKNRPRSNMEYWGNKIKSIKKRDRDNIKNLKKLGWDVLVIWECQIKNTKNITEWIVDFLGN